MDSKMGVCSRITVTLDTKYLAMAWPRKPFHAALVAKDLQEGVTLPDMVSIDYTGYLAGC
jgi:hypothetical protein